MIYQEYSELLNAWVDIQQERFEELFEHETIKVRAVVLFASNKNEEIKNGT
jgi:hypothetical protein